MAHKSSAQRTTLWGQAVSVLNQHDQSREDGKKVILRAVQASESAVTENLSGEESTWVERQLPLLEKFLGSKLWKKGRALLRDCNLPLPQLLLPFGVEYFAYYVVTDKGLRRIVRYRNSSAEIFNDPATTRAVLAHISKHEEMRKSPVVVEIRKYVDDIAKKLTTKP